MATFLALPQTGYASGADLHESFDALLKRNVGNGLVYYQGFDTPKFRAYLQTLAATGLEGQPRLERLAFWINAYNACVIANVLAHPGIKGPLEVEGFFKTKRFQVAGRSVTLDEIENKIIRPEFGEAMIHFALVCAARGCPPLIDKAYTADNVMKLMAENTRAYLNSPAGLAFDKTGNTLRLSKIFEWYREDFETKSSGLLDFIIKHSGQSIAGSLRSNRSAVKVLFLDYDWSLNARSSAP